MLEFALKQERFVHVQFNPLTCSMNLFRKTIYMLKLEPTWHNDVCSVVYCLNLEMKMNMDHFSTLERRCSLWATDFFLQG